MIEVKQIYKCQICGNIVEVVHIGAGELVCCGQPMTLQKANTVDVAQEKSADAKAMADKHVPVIEKTDDGYKVKIGSIPHPMEESHYIEWIEIIVDGKSCRHFLKPGEAPEAKFCIKAGEVSAREYCNLHGLWQT